MIWQEKVARYRLQRTGSQDSLTFHADTSIRADGLHRAKGPSCFPVLTVQLQGKNRPSEPTLPHKPKIPQYLATTPAPTYPCTSGGGEDLAKIALLYAKSVPKDRALAIVTPTFGMGHKRLSLEAKTNLAISDSLPSMGLHGLLVSQRLMLDAIHTSGRDRKNTPIVMSIGPPFDCYDATKTPLDIFNETLPQVFAAVRLCKDVDHIMFETTPSFDAAIAGARAFTIAHKETNLKQHTEEHNSPKLHEYLGGVIDLVALLGVTKQVCPSYNPKTKTYKAIGATKSYSVSWNLNKDGKVGVRSTRNPNDFVYISLTQAIRRFNATVKSEGLHAPAGFTVNCNSPAVTEKALTAFQQRATRNERGMLIGVHSNRATVDDPHQYHTITPAHEMPEDEFIGHIQGLRDRHKLPLVGGCCGVTPELVGRMARELR